MLGNVSPFPQNLVHIRFPFWNFVVNMKKLVLKSETVLQNETEINYQKFIT